MATCSPGKEGQAEVELLDALLRGGAREVEVLRTGYPGVLLVRTTLSPDEAYRLAMSMEMAYVRSVIPIHLVVKAELGAIREACLRLAKERGIGPGTSFAVRCRRRGRCLRSSLEVEKEVGEALRLATGARVDLEDPDVLVRVEIVDEVAGISILGKAPARASSVSPTSPSPVPQGPGAQGIKGGQSMEQAM